MPTQQERALLFLRAKPDAGRRRANRSRNAPQIHRFPGIAAGAQSLGDSDGKLAEITGKSFEVLVAPKSAQRELAWLRFRQKPDAGRGRPGGGRSPLQTHSLPGLVAFSPNA